MAKSILVVDGEPSVRESVAEAFVLEGYRATIAAGGADALAEVDRVRPDLIVLDLGSAERPGLELCRTLRTASSAPILLLGANGSDLDRAAALRAGADDLVRRPFRLRELTGRVAMLLRHTEAALSVGLDQGVIDLGRVRADLAGRRLLQGDRVVPLRPRAFALLAFFIRHPGQVFSREELLERVWGEDASTGTRSVDVHVHWLRQRIEEDVAHPALLQTVRGMGYVFRRPG